MAPCLRHARVTPDQRAFRDATYGSHTTLSGTRSIEILMDSPCSNAAKPWVLETWDQHRTDRPRTGSGGPSPRTVRRLTNGSTLVQRDRDSGLMRLEYATLNNTVRGASSDRWFSARLSTHRETRSEPPRSEKPAHTPATPPERSQTPHQDLSQRSVGVIGTFSSESPRLLKSTPDAKLHSEWTDL